MLLCAASYEANRRGLVRIRTLTDGWLTASALGDDTEMLPAWSGYAPLLPFFRGLTAIAPAREANGARALPGAPERELAPTTSPAPEATPEAKISEEEREQKQEAYRDYLTSEGLTPLTLDPP